MLATMLHLAEISCPQECVYYQSKWRAKVGRALSKLKNIPNLVGAPFRWFANLPWQTQIAIIVLIIVIVARPLIPLIVQLLNAYRGK